MPPENQMQNHRHRAGVLELERILRVGRRLLEGADAAMMARNFNLSPGEVAEAMVLAQAEQRGCLQADFDLDAARIAAGIE